jgi:hypothetical protein
MIGVCEMQDLIIDEKFARMFPVLDDRCRNVSRFDGIGKYIIESVEEMGKFEDEDIAGLVFNAIRQWGERFDMPVEIESIPENIVNRLTEAIIIPDDIVLQRLISERADMSTL